MRLVVERSALVPLVALASTIAMALLPRNMPAQLPQKFSIRSALSAPFPTELIASPTGSMAWVFDAEGVRNVWVAEPPAYAARSVTPYSSDVGLDIGTPEWRPDGRGLVFVRGEGTNDKGEHPNPALDPRGTRRVLMYVNVDGSGLREIGEGASPAISPDSRTVVFLRNGFPYLASIGDNSGDSSKARKLFVTRGRIGGMRWSPDGRALAFVSDRGDHSFVGVYDLGTNTLRYLDPDVDTDRNPVWSPSRVFASCRS